MVLGGQGRAGTPMRGWRWVILPSVGHTLCLAVMGKR